MNLNLNGMGEQLRTVTSAMKAATLSEELIRNQEIIKKVNEESIKNNEILLEGAKANITQNELLEQQLELFQKQNNLLFDNYCKLEEMYNAQVKATKDAKEDLRKSRIFNGWMMVIAIIAMLAAIAGPIATILASKL